MCGIAGYIYKDIGQQADVEKLKQMTDIISYRGPDDEGHFINGNIALGHRRLSIIDLSEAGHQPMISSDNNYIIVFNGEIYNYKEIKEVLIKKGYIFKTNTDTEVLLQSYREWGEHCVEQFNGMWSFVILDKVSQKVFMSRDRFGIKPFYYVNSEVKFAFASEIKAILAAFPEERQVNEAFVHYFLPSGALDDGEETFFENVKILMPAHSACYDIQTKEFKVWKYWDINEEEFRNKWIEGKEPVEALWELLNSSIKLHMRADVPVGTCLSGGIDSSTIVGIASKQVSQPIYTFSGLYADKDCDEKTYVDEMNNYANTQPQHVLPEPQGNLIEDLAKITWHMDEPSAGPGLYTQYYVMKEASKYVKVLLDGQGGDELFAGYLPYYRLYIQDLLDENKLSSRMEAFKLMLCIYKYWGKQWIDKEQLKIVLGPNLFKIAKIILHKEIAKENVVQEPPFFHPDLVERVKGKEITRSFPQRTKGVLNNTLYWHLVKQSIPALLHYEDRNSMAFSIESRVPLLDYRIVEFAMGLQSEYKIRGSWTKWILRKSSERVAPKKVAWRRSKLGYPTPFARWIREGHDKDKITSILFSESFLNRKLVSEDTIRFYYNQHMSGEVDRSWLLYRYVTVELWYRMFIDEFNPSIEI